MRVINIKINEQKNSALLKLAVIKRLTERLTLSFISLQKDEIYWPEVGESQTYNSYDIESLGEETIGQHSVVTLHLSHEHTVSNDKYHEKKKIEPRHERS